MGRDACPAADGPVGLFQSPRFDPAGRIIALLQYSAFRICQVGLALGIALSATISGQHMPDPYSTGMTLLSFKGCPVFVGGTVKESPAERGGVRPGDQVQAIAGISVTNIGHAARLLQSDQPIPVTIRLKQNGKTFDTVLRREKRSVIFARSGKKIVSGAIVPPDTTDAEVDRMIAFDGKRIETRVFPTHYPEDPDAFYAGFEMFILHNPVQVRVGGIEDGPASRAGVHWGDVLVSVNGVPTAGRTPLELKRMFLATHREKMRLQIDRMGSLKMFDFYLEKAQDIARQNGKRFVDGRLVPIWVSNEYLHCFLN